MENYLYNGIELPALPEWDKEKYPYAVINRFSYAGYNYYKLWLSPLPLVSDILTYDCPGFRIPNDGKDYEYMFLKCEIDGTEWATGATYTKTYDAGATNTVTFDATGGTTIWTNTDICSEDDGSLFLAASDPVPVSVPTPDPLSLVMGYRVGCAIRANR